MAHANTRNNAFNRAERRAAHRLERTILQRKVEAGWSRTTESLSEAITLAHAAMKAKATPAAIHAEALPLIDRTVKVHHLAMEAGISAATLRALFLHYKQETGAVLVLHRTHRRTTLPSCLGTIGSVIDSGMELV